MDRSKTVELMPIQWRLGTGRNYLDYPRERDLAAVEAMGEDVVEMLAGWLDDECKIISTGAVLALQRVAPQVALEHARRTVEEEIFDGNSDGVGGAELAFPVSRSSTAVEPRKRLPIPMRVGAFATSTLDLNESSV